MSNYLRNLLKAGDRGELLLPKIRHYLLHEQKELKHEEVVAEDARLTIACFEERLEKYEEKLEGCEDYVHPSQLSRCVREIWFSRNGATAAAETDGEEALRSHLVFEIGTYVHVLFQNLCEMVGVLEKREVMILNRKRKLVGHADGILKFSAKERALLEIKTINARGFASLTQGPKDAHKQQATTYMGELGLDKASIVYIDKDRSQAKEFVVPFDSGLHSKVILPRISYMYEASLGDKLPDREGINPTSMPCNYCPHSRLCFDSARLDKFMARHKNGENDIVKTPKKKLAWLRVKIPSKKYA